MLEIVIKILECVKVLAFLFFAYKIAILWFKYFYKNMNADDLTEEQNKQALFEEFKEKLFKEDEIKNDTNEKDEKRNTF